MRKLLRHRHSLTLWFWFCIILTRGALSSPITLINVVHKLYSINGHRLSTVFTLQLDQYRLITFQLHFLLVKLLLNFTACLINLVLLYCKLSDLRILGVNFCFQQNESFLHLWVLGLKLGHLLLTVIYLSVANRLFPIDFLQLLLVLYLKSR